MATTQKYHKPNTDTAAVNTYAAVAGTSHVLDSISYSYQGGTLSGGNIKVESPSGTVIWECGVTATGMQHVTFPAGLTGAVGQALIATLAAGSANVQGTLNSSARSS